MSGAADSDIAATIRKEWAALFVMADEYIDRYKSGLFLCEFDAETDEFNWRHGPISIPRLLGPDGKKFDDDPLSGVIEIHRDAFLDYYVNWYRPRKLAMRAAQSEVAQRAE